MPRQSQAVFVVVRIVWFIVAVALFWAGAFAGASAQWVGDLLKTLGVLLVVTLVDRVFFAARLVGTVSEEIKAIIREESQPAREMERCGVFNIFQGRLEAKKTIDSALEKANTRIWIQCVAFSNVLPIDSYAPRLAAKVPKGVDVKILLMDPLRSPAFFRAFLEDDPEHLQRVMELNGVLTDEDQPQPLLQNPYFETRLFREASQTHAELLAHPGLQAKVRYYGHTASFWLAIVDNAAFYQTYTFGRDPGALTDDTRLGNLMPVIACHDHPDDKAARPVEVLARHFNMLWQASEGDVLEMSARLHDRVSVTQEVFAARRSWFRNVYYSLTAERRKDPRHAWDRKTKAGLEFSAVGTGDALLTGALLDFSRSGIGIVVSCAKAEQRAADGKCEECLGSSNLRVLNPQELPADAQLVLQRLLGPQYERSVKAIWRNCSTHGTRLGLQLSKPA